MNEALVMETFDRRVVRRDARRNFFRAAGLFTATALGTMVLKRGPGGLIASAEAATTAVTDEQILNFALNLEYLEAQFYSHAAHGVGLPSDLLAGTGKQGGVIGGSAVPFSDKVVQGYAKEIALDEKEHVIFLRTALGKAAVAQPTIDIDGTNPKGAFSKAAQAAGLAMPGQAFNPYENDINFLLGAFIFEDVGVTAYKGAASLISNKTYLDAAAGILAVEAYHAGLLRTTLYQKGQATPSDISAANAISAARDKLDGKQDDDQGITLGGVSNIVPADKNGMAYGRTTGEVLNIVYLNSASVARGGFFPHGVNGTINKSA